MDSSFIEILSDVCCFKLIAISINRKWSGIYLFNYRNITSAQVNENDTFRINFFLKHNLRYHWIILPTILHQMQIGGWSACKIPTRVPCIREWKKKCIDIKLHFISSGWIKLIPMHREVNIFSLNVEMMKKSLIVYVGNM